MGYTTSPSALTGAGGSPNFGYGLNVPLFIGIPNPSLSLPLQRPRISAPPPPACCVFEMAATVQGVAWTFRYNVRHLPRHRYSHTDFLNPSAEFRCWPNHAVRVVLITTSVVANSYLCTDDRQSG